jgi:F0F1-type ATP synthase delta subunit
MATISTHNIAYALYEATKDKQGKDLEHIMMQSVEFLSRKNLLSKTPEILKELEKIIDKKEGIVRAKIETPEKLSKATEKEIEAQLEKRYHAKEVHLEVTENKDLIGGIKIQVEDEVVDLTLAHKIHQLQNHLIAQ